MKNIQDQPWWSYLDQVQKDLIRQSLALIESEKEKPEPHVDFSYIVFPAAKAYEGFLKKLFFELGLITRSQFSGERFRIGRALNPAIYKEYPHESVYEKLTRFCGGEEVAAKLWYTWKNSRNLVFHFFPEKENLISYPEAKKRVEEVLQAIDFSFRGCRVPSLSQSVKKNTFRHLAILYFGVFMVWSVYRFVFRLPYWLDELFFKPLIWILPMFFLVRKVEKRPLFTSLGFGGKNFQNSLLVILGLVFFVGLEGITLGLIRHRSSLPEIVASIPFSSQVSIFVYLITALVEETLFRGYFFSRLWEVFENSKKANLVATLGFILIHLPISLFYLKFGPIQIIAYFILLLIMSLGSGWLFSLTYNTVPSVFWHFLWNWQVILGI